MALRVGVGGIVHETNTYGDESFGLTPLRAFHREAGPKLVRNNESARSGIGGILAACESIGADAVPLVAFGAQPSGTIERSAYESMKTELLDAISVALHGPEPIEALSLDLHGAGVVDGIEDLEGDLGLAIKQLVGPKFPVVVTLDLHANISDLMVEVFDLMIGYRLYPHTDMWETGFEVTSLIPQLLSGALRPKPAVVHLPILLPTSSTDPGFAAARMNEFTATLETQPGVVDCSVFHGFPYTDVADVGVHIVVTTAGDGGLATSLANEIASWVWSHREEFLIEHPSSEHAVRLAQTADQFPVVINETSDNCGGGAPGDGTHLLRAMLDANLQAACFGFMFDPTVVGQAHAAGVGATISVSLGAKHDRLHGDPIVAEAYVKTLTDGRFVLQAMGAGLKTNIGPTTRLVIDGIDVIVGSKRQQTFDPELFLLHGIDVHRMRVIALKSSQHFRAGFRDVAASIITADSPGLTTLNVAGFTRANARTQYWPSDRQLSWSPTG